MKLISHRGAKGLQTENTAASISAAVAQPVLYIEFDIHKTSDDYLILNHDAATNSGQDISSSNYKNLLQQNPAIITLDVALSLCGSRHALIEIKSTKTAHLVAKSIVSTNHAAASFIANEVRDIAIACPDNKTFLLQHNHPFGIIRTAKNISATGIGINKNWAILLPFYYYKAAQNNLDMYTYTVNSKFLAKLLSMFMPNLMICTDRPDSLGGMLTSV